MCTLSVYILFEHSIFTNEWLWMIRFGVKWGEKKRVSKLWDATVYVFLGRDQVWVLVPRVCCSPRPEHRGGWSGTGLDAGSTLLVHRLYENTLDFSIQYSWILTFTISLHKVSRWKRGLWKSSNRRL